MNIAEWLRGEGFGAPLNLDGARWSYAESRVHLMEAKWALARILREAEDLQPFARAVCQWVLVLDGWSPPGKRDSVVYDEEKASDLTTRVTATHVVNPERHHDEQGASHGRRTVPEIRVMALSASSLTTSRQR